MTQRPLPQPLLSMQPSTLTQGSQQQPLPNQDLLSIAPLTSPRWMVYNEDPWAVGVPAFQQLLQKLLCSRHTVALGCKSLCKV